MTTVSRGKSYAGNPPERFEEGNSASAEPRRNSLLSTKMKISLMAALVICVLAGCTSILAGCTSIRKAIREIIGPPPTPPPMQLVDSDKSTIASVRALWEFERDYSLRKKAFVDSITELGDGSEIGRNGFCLRWYVWRARYEDKDRVSDKSRDDGVGYFYKLMPQLDEKGGKRPLSVVLAAIPEKDSDPAFVALCGPVDLSNDLSFHQKWHLYKFKDEGLLEMLKSRTSISAAEITNSLLNVNAGCDPVRCLDVDGGLFPTKFYSK